MNDPKELARKQWLAELDEQRRQKLLIKKKEKQERNEVQLVYSSFFNSPWNANGTATTSSNTNINATLTIEDQPSPVILTGGRRVGTFFYILLCN